MKMKITEQNGNIAYNDDAHVYWDITDTSKGYISVTQLIEKFAQPFYKEYWSGYKAIEKMIPKERWRLVKSELLGISNREDGIPDSMLVKLGINRLDYNRYQQGILDQWQEENKNSCDKGTLIHSTLEQGMYDAKYGISLEKYGIGGKFDCAVDSKGLNIMDYSKDGLYPELLIAYDDPKGNYNIAGHIDLFIKQGKYFSIIDWKTNKELKLESYTNPKTKQSVKMKYPLGALDDCNFMHYSLQLSTYAWMIKQNHPDWELGELRIVHFDGSKDPRPYEVEYLGTHVEKMLEFWGKENKVQQNKKKSTKIEY